MQSNGGDHEMRLSRVEGILEALANDYAQFREDYRQDYKQLLTAQVLLTDEVRKLAEAQRHTDERLSSLINVVDSIFRGQKQESGFAASGKL